MSRTQEKLPSWPLVLSSDNMYDWTAVENILKTSTLPGLTLEDIVEHLRLTGITVTSIQNALNPKHWETFVVKSRAIKSSLKEGTTIGVDIAFHGTAAGNVCSIYKQGFRLRRKKSFAVFCSPLFATAFNYGKKKIGLCRRAVDTPVFICAVLRGRVYVPEGRELYNGQPPGFDSGLWGGDQWLIYDTRQIIPVAVLWTSTAAVHDNHSMAADTRYSIRPQPGCGSGIDVSNLKGKRTGNRQLDLPSGDQTKRRVGENFFSFLFRRLNA
jgi:hypothetical protein